MKGSYSIRKLVTFNTYILSGYNSKQTPQYFISIITKIFKCQQRSAISIQIIYIKSQNNSVKYDIKTNSEKPEEIQRRAFAELL